MLHTRARKDFNKFIYLAYLYISYFAPAVFLISGKEFSHFPEIPLLHIDIHNNVKYPQRSKPILDKISKHVNIPLRRSYRGPRPL